MFEVTRRHMPPTEIVRLLDMVVVNVLVCNTDAHAKNYSVMIRAGGTSLAPMYDIMCGEVWENVTMNLANNLGPKAGAFSAPGPAGGVVNRGAVAVPSPPSQRSR
jgi:serine/threonine-protein kinase HipA